MNSATLALSDAQIQAAIGGPVIVPTDRFLRIAYWRFVLSKLEARYGREHLRAAWLMAGLGGPETEAKLRQLDEENLGWNSEIRATGHEPTDAHLGRALRNQ